MDLGSYLTSLTVPNVKLFAKTQMGIEVCPSSMSKSELITWLVSVYTERQMYPGLDPLREKGVKLSFENVVGVDLHRPFIKASDYGDRNDGWLSYLKSYGCVVVDVPGMTPERIEYYKKCFWYWMYTCNPNVREDNPSSWSIYNLPPSTRGIFKNWKIGHEEWVWKCREDCIPVFKELWGTEDLLTSFDGASVIFPPSKDHKGVFKNWFHVDQGRFSQDMISVQGILHFTDSNDMDGGFSFVEGSHKLFGEYLKAHPAYGYKWEVLDPHDHVFTGKRIFKPRVKAGQIVLFDSRLAHMFIPTRTQNIRLASYVCMQPRSGATQSEISKRQKLYSEGKMTGHWCYGPWFDQTGTARKRGKNADIEPPPFITPPYHTLSETRKRLIGI